METDYRSAESYRIEEAYWSAKQADADEEASALRLSIIEHLDARHADAVADLDLLGDAEFHPLPGVRRQYKAYVQEEHDVFAALELVRNIEGISA